MAKFQKSKISQLTMEIANTGTEDLMVLLTPGSSGTSAPGLISDSTFKGLTSAGKEAATATMTAKVINSNIKVADFLFQVAEGALLISRIRTYVSGDAANMIDKIMFEQFRFGEAITPTEIFLANYFDSNTNNERVVTVDAGLALNRFVRTTICSVPANSKVKIILYVVAEQNANTEVQEIIVTAIGGNVINTTDDLAVLVENKLEQSVGIDNRPLTGHDGGITGGNTGGGTTGGTIIAKPVSYQNLSGTSNRLFAKQ